MDSGKLIIAITGASGAAYAHRLLQRIPALNPLPEKVAVIFSEQGKVVWKLENGDSIDTSFKQYDNRDFSAPFASGSSCFESMIICPCSMGTLGRIASGISDSLITRAADVMLKERKKLILVTRETPLSYIHICNMKTVTEAGGIICPASPSFYSKPENVLSLIDTVVDRIFTLCGFEIDRFRWGE